MGRNPFLTYTREYIEESRPYLAASTIEEQWRKLRYLNRVLRDLKYEGRIESDNPRKMDEGDVRGFMLWMQEQKIAVNTQRKYLHTLNNLLRWCNNSTIDRMRQKRKIPRSKATEIHTMTEQEVEEIINGASKLGGWHGVVATFMCAFYPYTGLRPSELRLAKRKDLDVSKWVIKVSNPKGKNRYGVERTVPIPTPARLYVMDYLQQRDEYMRQHGLQESEQLIPRITAKGVTHYYSSNHFRKLKGEVQRLSGIEFRLKDFRSTYAQLLKDKGLAIEKVSKVLGHSSTETTERFYARIRDVSIFDDINNLWLDGPDGKSTQISVLAR